MENLENQNFESQWKKAFDGAEVAPSASVWQSLDTRLVHSENIAMKTRLVFYQRMAAASVVLLMLVSGYLLLQPTETQDISGTILPLRGSGGQSSQNNVEGSANSSTSTSTSSTSGNELNQELLAPKPESKLSDGGSANQNSQPAILLVKSEEKHRDVAVMDENRTDSDAIQNPIPSSEIPLVPSNKFLYADKPIATIALLNVVSLPEIVKPNDYAIAYKLADLRPAVKASTRRSFSPENTFASVGFAAGSFMPGAGGAEIAQAGRVSSTLYSNLQSDPIAKDEKIQRGTSISWAVSAGKRIFKRWVVQGGVSYLNQSASTQSTILEVAPANELAVTKAGGFDANSFSPEATGSVTYATPNEINSTSQFISVPLQAGYMLIDRKLGLQINGGLSPDFFLKNSMYDQSTEIETTQSGKNETFKTMSVSGLGGLELSYRFSKHYRVSLAPGFRYALTPIYKQNSLASAKTFVADIGLKFRYVFNQ